METQKSAWPMFKVACLNFLENVKAKTTRKLLRTCCMHTRLWCVICHWRLIFYIPTWLLPSEPGHSEWQTWRMVPLGHFHHGEKICRKVITEHVSWLLLEPYWRDVYCWLQTYELQKEVLNISKIKYLFSYFCCVIA